MRHKQTRMSLDTCYHAFCIEHVRAHSGPEALCHVISELSAAHVYTQSYTHFLTLMASESIKVDILS